MIILPLGIYVVVRMIPIELMADYRADAIASSTLKKNRVAAALIIIVWLLAATYLFRSFA